MASAARNLDDDAQTVSEPPRPLRRELPPAEAYPIDALGPTLGAAARAIMDIVRVPDGIAAQSVLGAASLAVMPYVDIELPIGDRKPTGLYLITVGVSGERKSSADLKALEAARSREAAGKAEYDLQLPGYLNQKAAYDAARKDALSGTKKSYGDKKAALDALGPTPNAPRVPMMLVPEPTFEGMTRLYAEGNAALGLFSDEGGSFIGGHGMTPDNRLKTGAAISALWDGAPIKKVRGGDGVLWLPGRRLAMHMMIQPDVANRLLSDPELRDQGFLSRLLVTYPKSTIGERLYREPVAESYGALEDYTRRLLAIMAQPQPIIDPEQPEKAELAPEAVLMTEAAARMWFAFADHTEVRLKAGADYASIRGFGAKLAEHAARIATVLAVFEDPSLRTLDDHNLARGIEIAQFYASEALRLFDGASASPEILRAEELLRWIREDWRKPVIALRHVYQLGPNALREAKTAKAAVETLVEHGHLRALKDGADIEITTGGRTKTIRSRDAWVLVEG